MSNAPYLLPKGRTGYRLGPAQIEDALLHDGLVDSLVPGHMGVTAENVAEKYGITREECDQLAYVSHKRAYRANYDGTFSREIVPFQLTKNKKTIVFDKDEHMIPDVDLDTMAKLPPAFKKEGVVTAANASGINDGAAAVIVMSLKKAREMPIKPLTKLMDIYSEGVAPELMGLGPAVAIPGCLKKAGISYNDIDYWEINEVFAAQFIGVQKMLKEEYNIETSMENINVNGSGIGLGHPVGCTALRIIVSLYYELEKQGHIAVITISRPEALNALNFQVFQDLSSAINEVEIDEYVYVAILNGEGRAFVTGADITEMKDFTAIEGK